MGGLGNQLHQVCFAKYLEKNNFETIVNIDWFNKLEIHNPNNQRKLNLNLEYFNLNIIDSESMSKYYRYEKISELPLINRIYLSRFNNYYKSHFGDSLNSELSYLKNRFIGYWQNPEFYSNQKEFLLSSLDKHEDFNSEVPLQKSSNTLIHIRRGDYIEWNEELPNSYYIKAIKEILKVDDKATFDIFTDSQDSDNDVFKYAENVYNDVNENPLITLNRMTKYRNFIIANSSFSFFGAFLASKESKKVFYPDPWFKSIQHISYQNKSWYPVKYLDL